MSAPIFHNFNEAPTQVAPFSHAVECDGWIQLTGQMPTEPNDDDRPLPEGIELPTRRVMDNLVSGLRWLGLGRAHALSCRVFPTEFARDYSAMNLIYQTFFPRDRLPARTCVGVTTLARDALVEIDMIVRRPSG